MSHTLELLSTIEHGTVAGYRAGCHGSAVSCGAVVSCATVYVRYQADWGFRKRINAGEDAADIYAAELADQDAVRERDKAANRVAKAEGARAAHAREVKQYTQRTGMPPQKIRDEVARFAATGATVDEMAAELSISPRTVARAKKALGIVSPRRKKVDDVEVARLHALGWSDVAIARQMNVDPTAVGAARKRLDLPVNRKAAKPRVPGRRRQESQQLREEVARLHGEGKTDAEISETLGRGYTLISGVRRELGLPLIRSTRSRWDTEKPGGHGTNASYSRGCRCEPCTDAGREYRREYTARRKEQGVGEHHGTAYGYQLGCRGKGCPSSPSCTQVMLEQDRARRRAAGVQEKAGPFPEVSR